MMTKMIREHYNLIATALHDTKPVMDSPNPIINVSYKLQWEADVERIAEVLKQTNPRFDYERFIAACNSGLRKPTN